VEWLDRGCLRPGCCVQGSKEQDRSGTPLRNRRFDDSSIPQSVTEVDSE
jgi:hypothetical protein